MIDIYAYIKKERTYLGSIKEDEYLSLLPAFQDFYKKTGLMIEEYSSTYVSGELIKVLIEIFEKKEIEADDLNILLNDYAIPEYRIEFVGD